jgi:hypothetical protein
MARRYAFLLGIVFLVVGVLGFVDPLTPDGRLFGLFMVNAAHNWFHLLSGVFGVLASRAENSRVPLGFAWFVLIVYGLLTLMGFMIPSQQGMLLGAIPVNPADNMLHLLLALSALAVIVAIQRRPVYR